MNTKKMWSRIALYSVFAVSLYLLYTTVYLDACERTRTYSIGTIYPQNAIAEWRLEELLWSVEDMWEEASGESHFRYVESGGDIVVNITRNEDLVAVQPGESFEKGSHFRGVIDIYHYEDEQDLIMVLAHEFGHALDLGHVPGDESIMAANFSQHSVFPLTLTKFDREELAAQCRSAR